MSKSLLESNPCKYYTSITLTTNDAIEMEKLFLSAMAATLLFPQVKKSIIDMSKQLEKDQ